MQMNITTGATNAAPFGRVIVKELEGFLELPDHDCFGNLSSHGSLSVPLIPKTKHLLFTSTIVLTT